MAKKTEKKFDPSDSSVDEIFDHYARASYRCESGHVDSLPAVPENRILNAGDEVDIGNLEDCVVVATRHEGRIVLVRHTSIESNYGNPIRNENQYNVWRWTDVIPVRDVQDTRLFADHWSIHDFRSTDLSAMIGSVLGRGLIDSPDYQRGYVWTQEDKVNYIDTIFNKRDLGKFVFIEDKSYKDERLEILDGKQRLSAIMGFYTSRFPYKGYYYHEMHKRDRRHFDAAGVQYAQIDRNHVKRSDLLRLFLDINCAGVPQTEEHLTQVRKLYAEALEQEAA